MALRLPLAQQTTTVCSLSISEILVSSSASGIFILAGLELSANSFGLRTSIITAFFAQYSLATVLLIWKVSYPPKLKCKQPKTLFHF